MFVKNYWELKLPFTINYQNTQIVIPFDNKWHEVPSDCNLDPNGVKGYLLVSLKDPNPPKSPKPQIVEINLDVPLYKRILSPEDQLKAEKIIQDSIKIAEETYMKKKSEKLNEQTTTNTSSITVSGNPISTINPQETKKSGSKKTSEKPKIDQPLKGFKLKQSVRNKHKEKNSNKSSIKKDDLKDKSGVNVSDEFKNTIDAKLGL